MFKSNSIGFTRFALTSIALLVANLEASATTPNSTALAGCQPAATKLTTKVSEPVYPKVVRKFCAVSQTDPILTADHYNSQYFPNIPTTATTADVIKVRKASQLEIAGSQPPSAWAVNNALKELTSASSSKQDADGFMHYANGTKLHKLKIDNVYPMYQQIFELAKYAYFSHDQAILDLIKSSLRQLSELYYYDGAPEKDNWWFYEIGIPKHIGKIVVLLYDYLTPEEREEFIFPTSYFQPDPYQSGVSEGAGYSTSPDQRLSTGGNRVDTALVALYRGLVRNNPLEIQNAINSMNDTAIVVNQGDGFHPDGTFIQHSVIPYNATYGQVLIEGFAFLKHVIKDTAFVFGNQEVFRLFDSFNDSYSYLLINGGITDATAGRAVYAYNAKYLSNSDNLKTYYSRKNSSSDLERGTSLQKLFKTLAIHTHTPTDNKYFYAGDFLVHRNAQQGAVVLKMHSSRIANFETINGDNPFGIYTGDAYTMIYGKDPSANVGYYLDYNWRYVPGTTEFEESTRKFQGERRFMYRMSPEPYVGAISSFNNEQFIAYQGNNWDNSLNVTNSYLANDKGLVVFGLVNRKSLKSVYTTIDQRRLSAYVLKNSSEVPSIDKLQQQGLSYEQAWRQTEAEFQQALPKLKPQVFADGKAITKNTFFAPAPKELVFVDDKGSKIGYQLYQVPNLEIVFENGFVRFVVKEAQNFSYGIYPQTVKDPNFDLKVEKFTNQEQIFYSPKQQKTYINFFKDRVNTYQDLTVEGNIQVVKYHNKSGHLVLELNDPTQLRKAPVLVKLQGNYELFSNTSQVTNFKSNGKVTEFEVNLDTLGKSISVYLKPKQ